VNLFRPLADRREIKSEKYWDIPFNPTNRLQEEIEDEFLDTLKASVKRRLISDVPLGVFLSGGIDSSSVVAMMSEIMPPENIKTFSIGFQEKSFDESSHARTVSKFFGTDHREDVLEPHTLLDILPEVCNTIDEPFADPSIIPTYLLSRFTRKHVTVALGGDGGDELFAGYDPFLAHYPAKWFDFLPRPLTRALHQASLMLPVSSRNISFDFKVKQFLSALHYRYGRRHFAWLGSFSPEAQRQLLAPEIFEQLKSNDPFDVIDDYLRDIEVRQELEGIIYLYCKLYLQDDILVKVDRASMANSLEVRAPFLDREMIEFVGTIPNNLKLKGFTTKYIMKKALERKLPREIVYRRKKGFGIPIAEWFRGDLKTSLMEQFGPHKVKQAGLFNYEHVTSLMQQHFRRKRDHRKQLWTLFIFSLWYDNYMT
jgi:asparagine synthase (glutamine-hydrolysing)